MMTRGKALVAGGILAGAAAVFFSVAVGVWAVWRGRSPEVVVWELKKGSGPADIGWKPAGADDIWFSREGDFDFTLISRGSRTLQFHQRCWAIGASRSGDRSLTGTDVIDFVYAHFAKDITIDEAVPLARKVLEEYGHGLQEPPAKGNLTLDQFYEAVKAGTYHYEQYAWQGKFSGAITFSFRGSQSRSAGGKRKCTLTFSPA